MLKFFKRWNKAKETPWGDAYKQKQTIGEKIHNTFQTFICYLIWDCNWLWLEAFISLLCDAEMYFEICKDKEFRDELATCNVCATPDHKTTAQLKIPDDPLYCRGCEYASYSNVANFFYGSQSSGYCYYLGKGDYSFVNPTQLLWDGCKECHVNCNWEKLEQEIESSETFKEMFKEE